MELNILILISTENPQYFKYISDKNTSHRILKSSKGQTSFIIICIWWFGQVVIFSHAPLLAGVSSGYNYPIGKT